MILKNTWRYRRNVIMATLVHCLTVITYLLVRGDGDSTLHDSVATFTLVLAYATLGGYIFGVITEKKLNDTTDETTVNEDTMLGTWKKRRRLIFITIFICIVVIDYLVIFGTDNALNGTISTGVCILHAALLNSYVFGAVFDADRLTMPAR